MKYYWFNRKNLLKNTSDKYHNKGGKQKAAEYYRKNADLIKLEAKNKYRNLSGKEENKKRKYQREKYHMNTDLNQYQRIIMLQKKFKKLFVFTV